MPRETFRYQITSPQNWENVNPKNKKLIEQFLREKNTRSSDLTIQNYRSDLEIFFTWNYLYNENKFFVDIKKLEFSEFFSYIVEEMKVGSARFSRLRSVLSGLSLFIEKYMDEEYPQYRNVILKTVENMPKVIKRQKTILSEEQINYLFEKLKEENEWQIACWLALAIGSGARFSELLRFTIDNISLDNLVFEGIFIETNKPIKTKGRTKSGKMLTKYIIKDIFWEYYQIWLEKRKEIMDKNDVRHNFIFIKYNGEPAQESTVRFWVEKIEKILGIPFYPHCLRHFVTTKLSKLGLPYDLIKDLFGWESVNMVTVYDDLTIKDKKFKELDNLKNSFI